MKILGAILAGGKSSRFGSDKALAMVGDSPLIVHVARSLCECDEILVVGRPEGALSTYGLRTTLDQAPVMGPVAGLITALAVANEEGFSHVFLTSCDMLGIQAHWPLALAVHSAPVVAIYNERWQPMCSLWNVAVLPTLRDLLAKSSRSDKGPSFQWIMDGVGAFAVPPPDGWDRVLSVNSPADLPD